jgi:hypothetical protein
MEQQFQETEMSQM